MSPTEAFLKRSGDKIGLTVSARFIFHLLIANYSLSEISLKLPLIHEVIAWLQMDAINKICPS